MKREQHPLASECRELKLLAVLVFQGKIPLPPEVERLGDISAKCCERVAHAVSLLSQLSKSSVAEATIKTCEEIDRLESDADRVMRSAMSRLFREESDVKQLIKLRSIYELLELITDRCEDVANIVEGIVLEHS